MTPASILVNTSIYAPVSCDGGLVGVQRERLHLFARTPGRTIRDIRLRQLERPPVVVAAASVELCGVVCEGEQVSSKKLLEANPRGVKLPLALFEPSLRD